MRNWPQKPPLGVPINWGDPLARGLVGCWLMNEGGGNRVNDLSGNGNVGTFSGDVSWSPAKFGNGVYFAGDTDYISIGDKATLENLTQVTLLAWCNPTNVTGQKCLIDKASKYHLELYNTQARIRTWANSADVIVVSDNLVIAIGVWSCVVGTYDGANNKIYVNGIFYNSGAQTGTITGSTAPVAIGAYSTTPSVLEFPGIMDHVMMWNRALTATEVQQLYMTPFRMFQESF